MYYQALAADGDGTLTKGGRMSRDTLRALERLRAAGGKLLLTTGESGEELADFPHLELFHLVVAENGAVLHEPATGKETSLCDPPPPALVRALRRKGITPLKRGRVILSTEIPQDQAVAEVLQKVGHGWRIIYNRRQVMILPAGVDKASGLRAALKRLGLSPRRLVAAGDAENDICLLDLCACSVALANAVPLLKERACLLTRGGEGRGIVELVERFLRDALPRPVSGKAC